MGAGASHGHVEREWDLESVKGSALEMQWRVEVA